MSPFISDEQLVDFFLEWGGWCTWGKLLFNSLSVLWGRAALPRTLNSEEIKLVCTKGSQFLGNLFGHRCVPLGLLPQLCGVVLLVLRGLGFNTLALLTTPSPGLKCPSKGNVALADFRMSSCWLESSKCCVNASLL